MSKKKKDEIVVTFLGGQSEHVTGSSVLISVLNEDGFTRTNILVDLGLIQGENTILDDYKANKEMLENIPLNSIDYVILTHEHIDHCGNLPALSKNEKVEIITNEKSYKIIKHLLQDTVFIHERNVEYLNGKGYRVKHLYREADFWNIYDKINIYEENKIHQLTDKISFRLLENSHVVGANQVELFIKKSSGVVKKILITGDLGSVANRGTQYFLSEQPMVNKADLAIIESTYGNKKPFTKKVVKEERDSIVNNIKKYLFNNGKNILIPCFSFGRTQNFMCWLYDTFKDSWNYKYKIIIDSTLSNKINGAYDSILQGEDLEYWNKVRNWGVFEYIKDYKSSLAFISKKEPALILSSSGMLNNGRAVLHAERVLGQTGALIMFCGYCSQNTVGGQILSGKDIIEVNGHTVQVRCDIKRYYTFSSHAQQDDLLNYIKQFSNNCTIVLHHGESEAKGELKRLAEEELGKNCKTNKIIISKKNMQITL